MSRRYDGMQPWVAFRGLLAHGQLFVDATIGMSSGRQDSNLRPLVPQTSTLTT